MISTLNSHELCMHCLAQADHDSDDCVHCDRFNENNKHTRRGMVAVGSVPNRSSKSLSSMDLSHPQTSSKK